MTRGAVLDNHVATCQHDVMNPLLLTTNIILLAIVVSIVILLIMSRWYQPNEFTYFVTYVWREQADAEEKIGTAMHVGPQVLCQDDLDEVHRAMVERQQLLTGDFLQIRDITLLSSRVQ